SQPYLEVHHKMQLAKGGEDTVENALGLCPNCHRYSHFGLEPDEFVEYVEN
ncbi:MAG: HNH endonuclease signature motif containing protein, partial [Candidatus Nitrotoga sp.]